jgi:hypothetical protein
MTSSLTRSSRCRTAPRLGRHVDYGEGETEDHTSREEAEAAADAVAQAEERTVVVEE